MKPSLASAPTVITCHSNADWDALSSMIGMSMIYPDSIMIFPGSMEKPLNQFFNETAVFLYTFKNIKEIDHASVKRVVVVDTQIRSRVPQVPPPALCRPSGQWQRRICCPCQAHFPG